MLHDSGLPNPDYLQAYFDALESVISRTVTSPPGSPSNRDRYIVPVGATGNWAGYDNEIAEWNASLGEWVFIAPEDEGTTVWVGDENTPYYWDETTSTWLPAAMANHNHDTLYYLKTQFIDAFTGVAGEPVKTNAGGKVDYSLLDGVGTYDYGVLAADPVSHPTGHPIQGDTYYNSVLDSKMVYDSDRSKWLSNESNNIQVGTNSVVPPGAYFKGIDGKTFSPTSGINTRNNGTVVALSWTRDDFDAATLEIMGSGVVLGEVPSAAMAGAVGNLNFDFTAGTILSVRNKAGGNVVTGVEMSMTFKWRA